MRISAHNSKPNFLPLTARLLFLVIIIAFSAQRAVGASRRLVFVTVDCSYDSASMIENYAALPDIDGLGLEVQWLKIEPRSGKYDWSTVDNAIRIAAKHRKYVTLYLLRSPKPPDWLIEGGKAQTFFSGSLASGIGVDTVPWDKVSLTSYLRLLQAAALHFKSLNMMPYIFAVGTVAPEKGCSIEGSRNGMLGTTAYNRSKYLLACEQMIDGYANFFPKSRQFVAVPNAEVICSPQRDPAFFQELMTYAISKHGQGCWLFARDLSSAGSRNSASYFPVFSQHTGIAYQVRAETAEEKTADNFNRAITTGLSNGAIYFEISPALAISRNLATQQTIERIHRN